MHAHTFNLKSVRTLGIILTCGALAVGCAHNGAKPMSQETSPIANSTDTAAPVASNETMPVEQNAVENTTPVANDPVSKPEETAPVVAENSAGNTATTAIQQPGQMTFYFGFNKTSLDDQDKTILKEHAEFLKANPSLVLEINGHTDHTGPHDYNEYLSKQRAESVAKILIAEGVTRSQLVIKALADDKPLADATQPGKNRRVELQYDEMNMVSSK